MKSILLTFLSMYTVLAYAQFDFSIFTDANASPNNRIENNSGYFMYSQNVVGDLSTSLHKVDVGDSILFIYTVNTVVPEEGVDTEHDTLGIELAIFTWTSTLNADINVTYRYGSFSYQDANSISSLKDTYKLVEGEVDTLVITVTDGLLDFDRLVVTVASTNVISNIGGDLLSNNIKINNPVLNEELILDLNGVKAELELISIQGEIVKEFTVTGSEAVSVADLNHGMYLLREKNGPFSKRVIIK